MSNPLMTDRAFADAAKNGWAAPNPATRQTPIPGPIDDGPTSPWPTIGRMTVGGTMSATGVLLVILFGAAFFGWNSDAFGAGDVNGFPTIALGCVLAGVVLTLVVSRKPMWAKFLAPAYAVVEGFFVGVVSRAYENYQDGIVTLAIGATLGVAATMFVLYRTRIIKVTDRLRSIVVGATMGLMLFYGVTFLIRLIAGADSVRFLSNAGPLGIAFSVLAAGLAAFNLLLDFDQIDNGVRRGDPKGMEWFAAFGLLVTLVWLYLELLRLISKLQRD